MSGPESLSAPPEGEPREYQAAVEAAEALYLMSVRNERDDERVHKLCDTINLPGLFGDRLVPATGGKFWETLPIAVKIAEIGPNFKSETTPPTQLNLDTLHLSRDALRILYNSLRTVDANILNQLDSKPRVQIFFSCLKLLLVGEYDYEIEAATNFLLKNRRLFRELRRTKHLNLIEKKAQKLLAFSQTDAVKKALARAKERSARADQPSIAGKAYW